MKYSQSLILIALLLSGSCSLVHAQAVHPQIPGPDDSISHATYRPILEEIRMGRTDKAIELLLEAQHSHPQDMRVTSLLADQYFRAGDYPRARHFYTLLTEEDSTDVSFWLKLAEIASFSQQYDAASDALSRVLDTDTSHLEGLLKMAAISERRQQEDAVLYYKRAYRAYPASQVAAFGLANWHIQSGEPRDALPICGAILALDSTSLRFSKLKGYALYKAGEAGEAGKQFRHTLDLGDASAFTFKYLGICAYVNADMDGAITSLREALARDSLDAESHFFLGTSLATTVEKKAALYHLDRSLTLLQPDPIALSRIHSEKGNLLRLQEKYIAAYHAYGQAWEADTTQPMSLYYMASILDNSLHRSEEALEDYQRFIEQLDRISAEATLGSGVRSVRDIVEDRIASLKEELFFLDR